MPSGIPSKKDDKAETEKKTDDLLSKVQNATALASSLKRLAKTESRKESRTSNEKNLQGRRR